MALEALVRLTDEELKHQELFRRLEAMMAADMPAGYVHDRRAERRRAGRARQASTWAVLALTLDIELFTQAHYRASIEPDADLSPLWKDVFLFHWKRGVAARDPRRAGVVARGREARARRSATRRSTT